MAPGLRLAGLALLLLWSAGCGTEIFRTQNRVEKVEIRGEKTVSRDLRARILVDPPDARGKIHIDLTLSETRQGWKREIVCPWGYVMPFDPLQKGGELLTFPLVVAGVLWEGFQFVFGSRDKGELGRGGVASPPRDIPGEDFGYEERARALHVLAGKTKWTDWAVAFMNPIQCSRHFPFGEMKMILGPVGLPESGPWRPARWTVLHPQTPKTVRVALDGQDLTAQCVGGRLDVRRVLEAFSGEGTELSVEMTGPDGGKVTASRRLLREHLEAVIRIGEIEDVLAENQNNVELGVECATLLARWGDLSRAVIRLEWALREAETSEQKLAWAKGFYGRLRERCAEDPRLLLRVGALEEFHTAILRGDLSTWAAGKEDNLGKLLFEHVASPSFEARARGIVALALNKDILHPRKKNALLLNILGSESNPLVLWAVIWALEHCSYPDGEDALLYYVTREKDPLLLARAAATLKKIKEED
jgi:hypothetical protein